MQLQAAHAGQTPKYFGATYLFNILTSDGLSKFSEETRIARIVDEQQASLFIPVQDVELPVPVVNLVNLRPINRDTSRGDDDKSTLLRIESVINLVERLVTWEPITKAFWRPGRALRAVDHGAHRRAHIPQCYFVWKLLEAAEKFPQIELAFCNPFIQQGQERIPVTVMLIQPL